MKDEELLTLIHKNIDLKALKKLNKTITKRMVDTLFCNLASFVKESQTPVPDCVDPDVARLPQKKFDTLVINIDGASRGNPGKSGIGIAIFDKDLKLIKEVCKYIGIATNNVSEYTALISGIKEAIKFCPEETLFKSDSELLVKQIRGEYRVKSPHLMALLTDAQSLLKKLTMWKIEHVPREKNKHADKLANQGVESYSGNT